MVPRDEPGPQVSQAIALATLREEEAESARQMIVIGRAIGIAALVPLAFIGGSVALRIAMVICVVGSIAAGAFIARAIQRTGTASDRTIALLALVASPAIVIAVLYFGVLSAAQLFPVLALYFFSRQRNRAPALAMYVANTTVQAVFAALFISATIEDPGLFAPDLPWSTELAGHLLIQISFLGAYLLGRGSHRASVDAVTKMQRALLLAAQRQALLQEARAELDRALAIDAAGPFSGQIFGSFRIGNVIGRGGMGDVYEASHVVTGEAAAVKMLGRRDLANPQSVERFHREIHAIRGLTSRHVVRVLETSGEQDEIPYLAMERLHGHDLAHHMRAGTLPEPMLLEMLAQVGEAIEEAWAKGVIHRDLKPQNLYLTSEGSWKVLDFGIAALGDHSGTLTQGLVVGTPAYMAPEQARGARVDHRADVYALGAVAYRWLTGRPLWASQDLHQALYHAVHVMPERPGSLVDLPEDVDAVFAIVLAKSPERRFGSCHELRMAFASAFEGALAAELRQRGSELLSAHPWGAAQAPPEHTIAM